MKKIVFSLLITFLSTGIVMASFPVKTEKIENKQEIELADVIEEINIDNVEATVTEDAASALSNNSGVDQEWLITLLLCVFIGGLAAHRWYAGKPVGSNILFILTGGGCGIWWLIDLIKILKKEF